MTWQHSMHHPFHKLENNGIHTSIFRNNFTVQNSKATPPTDVDTLRGRETLLLLYRFIPLLNSYVLYTYSFLIGNPNYTDIFVVHLLLDWVVWKFTPHPCELIVWPDSQFDLHETKNHLQEDRALNIFFFQFQEHLLVFLALEKIFSPIKGKRTQAINNSLEGLITPYQVKVKCMKRSWHLHKPN